MADSPFSSAIELLDNLGAFDTLFPFLLIFTLVYAILERSKVLGADKDEPKHNLNAMVAFVMAFLTIASPGIISFLNFMTVWIVVIFLTIVFLTFLIFAVNQDTEKAMKSKPFRITIVSVIVGLVILIFFIGFYQDKEAPPIGNWFLDFLNSEAFQLIIFLAVMLILVLIVVKGGGESKGEKNKNEKNEEKKS
ncbi:MAG: hypothetical protein PWR30_436 [Candidatus Woesearchaeota archaeon]|nr:hypothetical protein [Candidatus Woesearchaeota archaeon]